MAFGKHGIGCCCSCTIVNDTLMRTDLGSNWTVISGSADMPLNYDRRCLRVGNGQVLHTGATASGNHQITVYIQPQSVGQVYTIWFGCDESGNGWRADFSCDSDYTRIRLYDADNNRVAPMFKAPKLSVISFGSSSWHQIGICIFSDDGGTSTIVAGVYPLYMGWSYWKIGKGISLSAGYVGLGGSGTTLFSNFYIGQSEGSCTACQRICSTINNDNFPSCFRLTLPSGLSGGGDCSCVGANSGHVFYFRNSSAYNVQPPTIALEATYDATNHASWTNDGWSTLQYCTANCCTWYSEYVSNYAYSGLVGTIFLDSTDGTYYINLELKQTQYGSAIDRYLWRYPLVPTTQKIQLAGINLTQADMTLAVNTSSRCSAAGVEFSLVSCDGDPCPKKEKACTCCLDCDNRTNTPTQLSLDFTGFGVVDSGLGCTQSFCTFMNTYLFILDGWSEGLSGNGTGQYLCSWNLIVGHTECSVHTIWCTMNRSTGKITVGISIPEGLGTVTVCRWEANVTFPTDCRNLDITLTHVYGYIKCASAGTTVRVRAV